MSEKNVVIDARYYREESSGVGTYCRQLLHALDNEMESSGAETSLTGIFLDTRKHKPPRDVFKHIKIETTPVDYATHPHNEIWMNLSLPKLLNRLEAHVYHNPAFIIPRGKKFPLQRVVSIHDLIVFDMPGNYGRLFSSYMKSMIRRSIKRADRIVVFTDYVRQEILKRFKLQPADVTLIPHGVSHVFKPVDETKKQQIRRELNLPEKYIFAGGSSEPRKNLHTLIKAFGQLKKEHPIEHKLLISISDKLNLIGALKQLVASLGLNDSVSFFNVEDEAKMHAYYACCNAFVFPSRSEGFGFPVLEAMASGVPVLCSNIEPLAEISGECAIKFEPDDYVTLAKKLYNLIIDEDKCRELARCGLERVEMFTWQTAARRHLDLYQTMSP